MTDLAIRAESLGKRYRLGGNAGYGRLTEVLWTGMTASTRRLRGSATVGDGRTFWALHDVSFDVQRGEAVGIVGRNGAGKSTLLKVLSRVTAPTRGRAEIYGRVGSLLEVGTGFHPELTGRENVLLNGSMLGMSRSEIRARFDDIVAFAEVERFIDTPVKRYSSGMQVRLAFSVAAHLDTEILIVDEVLAVGDAAFQKKCIGKMSDVAGAGKTVLFVSHNLAAVRRMCPRSLLLEAGAVVTDGDTGRVIDRYLISGEGRVLERSWPDTDEAPGDDAVRLLSISVTDAAGDTADSYAIGDDLFVTVKYRNLVTDSRASVGIHLWSAEGIHLFASHDFVNQEWAETPRVPGLVSAACRIPGHFLAEGRYLVTMTISTFTPTLVHHVVEREVLAFSIVDETEGEGVRGPVSGDWPGVVRPMLEWTLVHERGGRPA